MADVQDLIVNLSIRDNLSLALGRAKDAVGNFGDTASLEALKASNAFANAGDQIRSKFAGLSTDLKKGIGLGLGIGTVQLVSRGVSELTGFVQESIQAFADEEAGIKRLTQALEVNAPAWDRDSAAIEKVIQSRQALGFADDQLRESLGSLTAATHDVDEGFRLQALAMDLARFKGISLSEASDQLVKVQAGSFRALKSLGIELDKNATSTEALGAIQLVVAGQAEKFAETTAGAMARAGIAVQNLQEDIGEGLAPAIEKAASALDDILSKDLPAFAENSKREVGDLTHGFQDLAGVLQFPEMADLLRDFAVFTRLAQDGKPAVTGITEAVIAQSIAMGDSSRETLLSAKALAILAADTEQLKGSATSATPAEIALAKATIEASEAHRDLAEATKAATEAGPGNIAALVGMAEATSADELATAKLKATQDLLKVSMLGAENGTDTLSGSLVRGADAATIAASAYGLAADQIDRLKGTGGKPFVAPPPIKVPGFEGGEALPTGGGMSSAEGYLARQRIDRQNRLDRERRDEDAASERRRLKSEADAARDKALSEAKAKAQERYNRTLQNTKDIATTLFDAQHARTLRAIKDTETLAQKQHDGALQQINDALKLKLETNAAPVTEAEENQQRIELARQRRDLAEALAQARRGGDPAAIRSAQEAIQSFQAQQGINALRLEQAKKDAAAQEEARIAQKAADDQLAAAKIASAKDIEAENLRNKTQRARFDKELEALKRRDAGASPAKLKADIAKLEEKFGITTDAKGFHHIADVLETVAKDLKPPLTGIGDAAAGATPGLAAVGTSAKAAADGLAVFAKRLGEFAIVEPHLPRETTTPVIRDSDDDLLAAIKNLKLSPIIQPTLNVEIAEQPKPVDIDRLLAAISAQKEKAQPKDDLSPILKDIGDAAATATPRLAGLASAEVTLGRESVTAADGLAVFTRRLGELKVLELPVPKPVEPPDIRQPVTVLDQPRLSEAEILATAIKRITFEPTIMVQSTVNVTSPPIFLNGRLIAAAMASSQSPAATPGIRTGTLSPRP